MNWLQKISELEREWWRNAQLHMCKTVEIQFPPLPRNSWPYDGEEIVYLPRTRQPIVDEEFVNNGALLRFIAFRKLKMYECFTELAFGLENIDINLIEMSCYIKRITVNQKQGWENAIKKGPVKLPREKSTPYDAIEIIKELILNDWDNNRNEEQEIDPAPYNDSYIAPDLVDEPEFVS